MRALLAAALLCAVVLGALAVLGLRLLDGEAYDAEAYARFAVLQSLLGWLKWIVPIALLAGAARVARTAANRGVALALLCLPLLLFVTLSWLDWVILSDAAAAYLQAHGRGAGLPGSGSYLLVAYPLALLVTLATAFTVLRRK